MNGRRANVRSGSAQEPAGGHINLARVQVINTAVLVLKRDSSKKLVGKSCHKSATT